MNIWNGIKWDKVKYVVLILPTRKRMSQNDNSATQSGWSVKDTSYTDVWLSSPYAPVIYINCHPHSPYLSLGKSGDGWANVRCNDILNAPQCHKVSGLWFCAKIMGTTKILFIFTQFLLARLYESKGSYCYTPVGVGGGDGICIW